MTRREPTRCPDATLVRRVRHGDGAAFAALWARHEDAARRALVAVGADPAHLPFVRVATSAALRGRTRGGDPVRRHILRIVGRWAGSRPSSPGAPAASVDLASPILRAYTGLGPRARTLLWYRLVDGVGPHETAVLLGGGARRAARRADAAQRRLLRRWLAGAQGRGLSAACYRVRRHELLGSGRALGVALSDHAQRCPTCVIAEGSSPALLAHLRALLIAAELGTDAASRYLGERPEPVHAATSASVASVTAVAAGGTGATASAPPFDDIRFSGLTGDDLPAPGLTRSAMTVLDSDGFEYSLGPVLVPEGRVRGLLAELAEAAEQV